MKKTTPSPLNAALPYLYYSNELKIGSVIYRYSPISFAKGSMAEVYTGIKVGEENTVLAIKKITRSTESLAQPDIREFVDTELEIAKSLKHPNSVTFFDQCETSDGKNNTIFIVMEFYPCGDLFNYLVMMQQKMEKVPTSFTVGLFLDLAKVVNYLHENLILHRDIKPENILLEVDSAGKYIRCKLADYGLAVKLSSKEDNAKTVCGSRTNTAPEVLKGCYGLSADIFSLGTVFYVTTTLRQALPNIENGEEAREAWLDIIHGKKRIPQFPVIFSDLTHQMLNLDSKRRPTAAEVLRQVKIFKPTPESSQSSSVNKIECKLFKSHLKRSKSVTEIDNAILMPHNDLKKRGRSFEI